jgi:hypothetical protein
MGLFTCACICIVMASINDAKQSEDLSAGIDISCTSILVLRRIYGRLIAGRFSAARMTRMLCPCSNQVNCVQHMQLRRSLLYRTEISFSDILRMVWSLDRSVLIGGTTPATAGSNLFQTYCTLIVAYFLPNFKLI